MTLFELYKPGTPEYGELFEASVEALLPSRLALLWCLCLRWATEGEASNGVLMCTCMAAPCDAKIGKRTAPCGVSDFSKQFSATPWQRALEQSVHE